DRAGANGGPDVITDEFLAEVLDVCGLSAGGQRLFARRFQIFLLTDVADHSDDFAAVVFLEPRDDDGGVEASGVGENNFFGFTELLVHSSSLFGVENRIRRAKLEMQARHAALLRESGGWLRRA